MTINDYIILYRGHTRNSFVFDDQTEFRVPLSDKY